MTCAMINIMLLDKYAHEDPSSIRPDAGEPFPEEDEFTALRGRNFVSRTFIPFSISINQEVGSFFVYKWDTMNEVVDHFDLLFRS